MTTRQATAADLRKASGDVFRYLRERAGMSQRDLADKMHTSRAYVSRVEGGRILPGMESLMEWAKVFNVEGWKITREIERQARIRREARLIRQPLTIPVASASAPSA